MGDFDTVLNRIASGTIQKEEVQAFFTDLFNSAMEVYGLEDSGITLLFDREDKLAGGTFNHLTNEISINDYFIDTLVDPNQKVGLRVSNFTEMVSTTIHESTHAYHRKLENLVAEGSTEGLTDDEVEIGLLAHGARAMTNEWPGQLYSSQHYRTSWAEQMAFFTGEQTAFHIFESGSTSIDNYADYPEYEWNNWYTAYELEVEGKPAL